MSPYLTLTKESRSQSGDEVKVWKYASKTSSVNKRKNNHEHAQNYNWSLAPVGHTHSRPHSEVN